MNRWLLLLLAIGFEVTGSLSLKAALDNPAFYVLVFGGFIVAFLMMTSLLRKGMPLGVAYGIWAASGVALTSVMAWAIYGEPMTRIMALGVVLIVAGVTLVHLGSRDVAPTARGHAVNHG